MSDPAVYPVQVLREHLTGLEAAMAVCLADPDHKAVHKLRTETRRVEALLALLPLIPGVPEHRKEAAATFRALAKLRRAAGEVRDLDVHRKMLEVFAGEEEAELDTIAKNGGSAAGSSSPKKSLQKKARENKRAHSAPENGTAPQPAEVLGESATELRKHLGRARDKAARALLDLLQKRQVKTARIAEDLMKTLAPAEDLDLSGSDLLRDAEAVLTRDGLLTKQPVTEMRENDLHTIRKSAKQARYLAESLPDDANLAAAARRFETMQDAGGQWHDALEIARAARQYFGKGHELTAAYRELRDQRLLTYRDVLSQNVAAVGEDTRSTPNGAKKSPSRAGKTGAKKVSKAA